MFVSVCTHARVQTYKVYENSISPPSLHHTTHIIARTNTRIICLPLSMIHT